MRPICNAEDKLRVDLFDFDLPDDRIALRPVEPRDAARLLVVQSGDTSRYTDKKLVELPMLLNPGDCLVFNDTKVVPARLHGLRSRPGASGAKIEVTLHQRCNPARWWAFARPAKRLKPGDRIRFIYADQGRHTGGFSAEIVERGDAGEFILFFDLAGADLDAAIAAHGEMPLPPYIASKRPVDDRDQSDYQTVFARHEGAVAAPTAGLHFTPGLMSALAARGIASEFTTLHVGGGTFLSVKSDDTSDHHMHSEWGEITPAAAERLHSVRINGGRVIAVGTSCLRLLEASAVDTGKISAFSGTTDIFITPGYEFRAVDGLVTNFHLPRSTLFMLVSAFCGLETMQAAYVHAIRENYRFYSYGDVSLLWPASR